MAQKKLNKNLIISLTLFVFVMTIVLAVLMFRQLQQRDPKHFIELADQYAARSEWKTAGLFYKKAWDRSHDAMHLVQLADALLRDGEVGRALGSLDQALINQPDLLTAHDRKLDLSMELARLYGTSGDWKRVAETADGFLAVTAEVPAERRAAAHHAKAMALIRPAMAPESDLATGEAELRNAIELAPGHVEYSIDLFEFLVGHDRAKDGEALLAELLAAHTAGADAAKVRLASARYMAATRRWDEADAEFQQSLAFAESDTAALRASKLAYALFLAQRWATELRDHPDSASAEAYFNAAESQLRECIDTSADEYDAYLQLATLYGAARRYDDMLKVCDARLERGLVRKGVAGPRNRMNAFSLMLQASKACVDRAEMGRVAGDEATRQAWLDKADAYVASAQGEFPDRPPVLSQAGRVKLARGLERQALEDLRRADEGYRAFEIVDWETKYLLASLHLRLNEAGAAKAVLEDVLADRRRPRAADDKLLLLYAQVLFKTDELDRALAVADQLLVSDPDNADARRIKAAVRERQGRAADAASLVGSADRVIAAILNAREEALNGDSAKAVSILEDAMKEDPKDVRLISALMRQLLAAGKNDEARAVVDKALGASPDDLQLQALAVLTQDALSEAERDSRMLEIIKRQPDGYQRALELIDFYVRRKQWAEVPPVIDDALGHLAARDTAAAQRATSAQHRALLATKVGIAAELGNADAMASARDEAARVNVDGAGGKTVLGLYHMHRKEYDLAIKAFTEATDAQPTDARSLAYLGQCLQLVARNEDAEAAYRRAVQVNPNEGQAFRGLAALAQSRGDTEAFESAFATCQKLIPDDPWVAAQALAKQEAQSPREAIARREARLADEPDDAVNLYRLASLCEVVEELTKADGYYEKLLALEPNNKDLVVAVSKYFRRTNRPERSLTVATRYAETRTTPSERAEAQIIIASHYLSTGELDRVEAALLEGAKIAETLEVAQSLVEYYLQQARRPDLARPWLDKTIALARAADSPRLPQLMATRISAVLRRSIGDLDAARRYIDELLLAYPTYPPAFLLRAELHARLGEIDRAIESLTEYLRLRPDDAFALYQRALHAWSQGRISRAIEDLSVIKRVSPNALNLEPRFLLAMLWRQSGDLPRWTQELESLVREAPDSSRAIEQLTRAYAAQRRLPDAERLATSLINAGTDASQSRWFFLRSRIMLETGDAAKALADAKRGAEVDGQSPSSLLAVMAVFLRSGRAAEGVEYYERYAPANPASAVIASGYALLLIRAGQVEKGTAQFRTAMRLAIDDSAAVRGRILADLQSAFPTPEELDRAVEVFSQSAGGTADPATGRLLAGLYQLNRKYDLAADQLQRLLTTAADDRRRSDIHHDLGDLFQSAGRLEDARAAFEEAIRYNPENWLSLNNLAYLLADHLKQHAEARGYAERAVEIADNAATLDTLGWIYVGLGEQRRAVAELSRAVRLAPDDPLSYYHLGEAYRRLGEQKVAESVLRSGLTMAEAQERADMSDRFQKALERVGAGDTEP